MDTLAPWDQLKEEPDDAFYAFGQWLLSDDPRLSTGPERRWSWVWRWRARRAAYRRMLGAQATAAAIETAKEQGRRHGEALTDLFELAHDTIQDLRSSGRGLSAKDAIQALKLAIELERLRAGEPGQRVTVDYTQAGMDDLIKAEAMLAALTAPREESTDGPEESPDEGLTSH